MTQRLIVANWKMNLLQAQACELATKFAQLAAPLLYSSLWVAPSFTFLSEVAECAQTTKLMVGAQNIHWEPQGAFTGEVSPTMLREVGCTFAIVGHSERRHIFGELDDLVVKRALGALNHSLKVIFCVGETLTERENGATEKVIARQLSSLLQQLKAEHATQLVIAYEPVWAIGTGKVATSAEIGAAHGFIRSKLPHREIPILYGGSVAPDNFKEIIGVEHVSGALIGGASLHYEKIAKMVEISEAQGHVKF